MSNNVVWKRITQQRKARLERAAVIFNERQARVIHPEGTFEKHGVWYPSDAERQPCCEGLREPTRKYPYSLITHCRTVKHVAHLCDVPKALLKAAALEMPAWREMYKAVHYADGNFRSCYAPKIVYLLGQEMAQKPRMEQGGGYYAYYTLRQAMHAALPRQAARPTHILKVRVGGHHVAYDEGRTAWERMMPIEVALDLGNARLFGGHYDLEIPMPNARGRKGYVYPTVPVFAETLEDAIATVLKARLPIGTKLYRKANRGPVWELTGKLAGFLKRVEITAVATADALTQQGGQLQFTPRA